MAVSVTSQTAPYVDKLVVDTDANATAEDNTLTGAATGYIFDVDNGNNSAPVYAKFFNTTNATTGTTEPSVLMLVPGNVRQVLTVSSGVAFSAGLSFACVAGSATANAVSPVNSVTIRVMAE
tara:strand:- start:648 stop:1013 length:366 start_codon:yes stop_codon:yes gene_type:complete